MRKVLVFAPHNDDEVLGVGGTIAKFSQDGNEVYVCEVTSGDRKLAEFNQSEARKAHKIIGVKDSFFLNLPVNHLRVMDPVELNAAVYQIVQSIQPEIVFLPHHGDMHTDHGAVTAAVMVAVRPKSCPAVKQILEYETLSETGWNLPTVDNAFIPNVYVDISNTIELKIEAMRCYENQIKQPPHPRSLEAIRSLSEYRGSTICVSNAEAFALVRGVF